MSKSNVIAEVRRVCARAIKAGDTTVQPPSKWAAAAGFQGSAASPLRAHMARNNGNGCGRNRRYPAVDAEGMLELLDLADKFEAEQEQRKAEAISRRIGTKLRPAQGKGARSAKSQARSSRPAKKAAKTEEAAVAE